MGVGGWMLQEGYMFRLSNIGQQYKIRAKIEELIGTAKTEEFYNNWLANHTRKLDIDSMAVWGFNSIRLPIHYNLYTLPIEKEAVAGQDTWIEKGFTMTDSLLKWCKANNIYLILDLHAAPGGQGNDLAISDRDPDKPSLWDSEANQKKTIALWRKLAERYANEPWIGGYDIINEPNWGFEDPKDFRGTEEKKNEPLRKLMVEITKAIREVDKNHLIIIEGNGFGNNYNGILPAWDNNMALSFHKYGNFTDVGSIKTFLSLREKYNVPLWLGESGENSNTWFTNTIRVAEENNIGWAWWQSKKIGINNPMEIKMTPSYQKLLDYWSGKGAKPSKEEALAALAELVNNIKLENTIYHPDVIDAMFRQVKSTEAIPFTSHIIGTNTIINAVDFDMGRNNVAYSDKDTASYHYTPGVNTTGNRGRAYRNDGVDIQSETDSLDYHVFSIENGEWLQYSVELPQKGTYMVTFNVASKSNTGKLSLLLKEKVLASRISIPNGNEKWGQVTLKKIKLPAGKATLRVLAETGGFNFKSVEFKRTSR
jgi:aryl-phospho-beta-D-glucosidase BglC (GH1 family)